MIRNLKTLGLALVAVFAMSAVAASVAAAAEETNPGLFTANVQATEIKEEKHIEAETAKIDGEQLLTENAKKEKIPNTFTLNGLALTCGTVTLKGKALTPGPSSTEVTLEPTFGPNNCHVVIAGLTKTVTVTTNECAFVFNAKTTVTETGFDHTATTTIECPKEKQIEVHVYAAAGNETTTTCTYDIGPQGPLGGITLTNKINTPTLVNDIEATISVTTTVTNTIKSAVCGQNSTENAIYEGAATLQATNEKGELVDASVSD